MARYYAYIHVSTNNQKTDRQFDSLNAYSKKNKIKYDCIFEDKVSGRDFNRPQYKLLKEKAIRGDTIVINELDRLGRTYEEMKNELDYFHKQGIKVIILDLPILNIEDEKLAAVINDIISNLLSYIAEKEIIKMKQRIKEGIESARGRGAKLGRPFKIVPKSFYKYYDKYIDKEIKIVEFARLMGVSRNTIYRYIKKHTEGKKIAS